MFRLLGYGHLKKEMYWVEWIRNAFRESGIGIGLRKEIRFEERSSEDAQDGGVPQAGLQRHIYLLWQILDGFESRSGHLLTCGPIT